MIFPITHLQCNPTLPPSTIQMFTPSRRILWLKNEIKPWYLLQRRWVMWSEMFVNFTSNLLCVELEFKYLVGTLGSEVVAMRSLISWFWLCLFLTCLVHPCPGKLPCFLSNSVFACSLLGFWLPDPQSEDLAALWSFTFWIILSLDYCPTDFLRNGLIAGIIINRNCLL